jgi:AraC family transcriptional activator of tynA and feaB
VNTQIAIQPGGDAQLVCTQLRAWREIVCDRLIGIEVMAPEPDQFRGSFTQFNFGMATLSNVAATPICGRRPAGLIAPRVDDGFLINMVVSGFGQTAQNGHSFDLQPGDLFIQDIRAPYSIEMNTDFRLITLRSPRDLTEHYLLTSDILSAMPLSREPGMGRIAGSLFLSLAANAADLGSADRELALSHVLSTLGTAYANLTPVQPRTAQHTTYSRASRFIDAHLRHPTLGPAVVAKACGITLRHLSRLFGERADTVSRTILRRRLERCRLDLLSRALVSRSIGEIAYYWGFNNLSHFSETFRRAYGLSPRELRRQSACRDGTRTTPARGSVLNWE